MFRTAVLPARTANDVGALSAFARILEQRDIRVTSACSAGEILVNNPAEFLRRYFLRSGRPDLGHHGWLRAAIGPAGHGGGVRDNGVIHPIVRAGAAA